MKYTTLSRRPADRSQAVLFRLNQRPARSEPEDGTGFGGPLEDRPTFSTPLSVTQMTQSDPLRDVPHPHQSSEKPRLASRMR